MHCTDSTEPKASSKSYASKSPVRMLVSTIERASFVETCFRRFSSPAVTASGADVASPPIIARRVLGMYSFKRRFDSRRE